MTLREIELAKTRGQVMRLVATIEPEGRASVQPESLPVDDFLAGTQKEENRLIINGAGGRTWQVSGKGAGRWPTAEAVIADMLDIHAATAQAKEEAPVVTPACGMHAQRLPPLQLKIQQQFE